MTFTHNDIDARLIDFLYGELDADARQAFEGHLAGCDRCRGEVRSLERVRRGARQAVRADLGAAPPAAVRARILDAARGAAAERAAGKQEQVRTPAKSEALPWWRRWLGGYWLFPAFGTAAAMVVFLVAREAVEPRSAEKLSRSSETAEPLQPAEPAMREPGALALGGEAPSPPPAPAASAAAPPPNEGLNDLPSGDMKLASRPRRRPAKAASAPMIDDFMAGAEDRERSAKPVARLGAARGGKGAGTAGPTGEVLAEQKKKADQPAARPGKRRDVDLLLDRAASAADKDTWAQERAKEQDRTRESAAGRRSAEPLWQDERKWEAERPVEEKPASRKEWAGAAPAGVGSTAPAAEAAPPAAAPAPPPPPPAPVATVASTPPRRQPATPPPPPAASPSVPVASAPRPRPAPAAAPVVAKAPAAAQATAPAAGAAAPPTARAAKPAPAEPEANAGWNDAEEAAAEQASSRWVAKSAKSAEPPARAADPKAGVRRQADEGRTSGNETVAALVERAEKLIAAQRWHDAAAIYQDLLRRHPQHPDAPAWRRKLAVAEAERARFAAPPPAKAAEKAAKARKTAPAADSPAY